MGMAKAKIFFISSCGIYNELSD